MGPSLVSCKQRTRKVPPPCLSVHLAVHTVGSTSASPEKEKQQEGKVCSNRGDTQTQKRCKVAKLVSIYLIQVHFFLCHTKVRKKKKKIRKTEKKKPSINNLKKFPNFGAYCLFVCLLFNAILAPVGISWPKQV